MNTSTNTITITGSGFSAKTKPTVQLGGTNLTVDSYAATSIVASLGSVTAPGTYLLTVTSGVTFAAADVTLGAVGPQGPIGPLGSRRGQRARREQRGIPGNWPTVRREQLAIQDR